jgi:hypothetical protein
MHLSGFRAARACVALGLLSAVAAAFAGMPSESLSRRDGVFATWFSPALVDSHVTFDSRDGAKALARHCRAGRPVHLLPAGTRYTCRVEFLPIEEAGNDRWLRLWVTGPAAVPDRWVHGVFTVSPPHHVKWTERPATAGEQAAVDALRATDRKVARKVKARAVRSARAVSAADGGRTIVVVAGQRVSDPFGEEQRHQVFLMEGESARHLGELPDRPARYVDVDGDDLPEVVTDSECDGTCVNVWTLSPRPKSIVRFGGH